METTNGRKTSTILNPPKINFKYVPLSHPNLPYMTPLLYLLQTHTHTHTKSLYKINSLQIFNKQIIMKKNILLKQYI